MTRHKILIAIGVALLLVACGPREIYNQYVSIPEYGWNQDSLAVFRVDVEKADAAYDILLMVRNESTYPNSNLWLFVDVFSPDGHQHRDTLELQLADVNGRWLGSGWGSLYSLDYPFMRHTRFAAPGTYVFRIAHGMRHEDIQGIRNIGLKVETSEVNQ